ncbi:MAG: hypothetical protein AAB645_02340 [Patescibacteria group bacterium]
MADLIMMAAVVGLAFTAWQKSAEVANLIQQAEILNQKQSSLANLKSAATDSQKVINALFINNQTKAVLIAQLEELGAKAGVEYVLNKAEDQGGLRYDITIKGNFTDVYHFISLVENLPYQIMITSANLEKVPSQKDENLPWSANLIIGIANLSTSNKQ